MEKESLGVGSTTFSPTFGRTKLDRFKDWFKRDKKYKSQIKKEYNNMKDGLINPVPDPYSIDIYSWIDTQIDKASKKGLKIPGKYPKKSKKLGIQVEGKLYRELISQVNQYLDNIHPGMTQTEILVGTEDIISRWVDEQSVKLDDIFRELHSKGFLAGAMASGVKPAMKVADKLALEWLSRNPERLGGSIKEFSLDLVEKFRGIIAESFGPEGSFSVDELTNRLSEETKTQRYKLERIVRTEVATVSGMGRLLGWSKDPDKYYYEYVWINPMDHRSKPVSRWRVENNPYTFDEAAFLWANQGQNISGKIFWDMYNQRCSISRRPINNEFKGNRFQGNTDFIYTTNLGFSV